MRGHGRRPRGEVAGAARRRTATTRRGRSAKSSRASTPPRDGTASTIASPTGPSRSASLPLDELADGRSETGQRDDRTGGDRCSRRGSSGSRRAASRRPARPPVAQPHVDRGPGEAVSAKLDRRGCEPARAAGCRDARARRTRPAPPAARPSAARRRATCPTPRPRRAPPARHRSRAAPRDRRRAATLIADEVAAEPALRRQQHGLDQRRRHHGVVGVAAGAQHLGAGRSGQRCRSAHDAAGAAAGALLGHHVERRSPHHACAGPYERSGTPRRGRSGCGCRATASRRCRVPARPWPCPGRSNRVPSGPTPVEAHGHDHHGLAPIGGDLDDQLVGEEAEVLDRRPHLRPLLGADLVGALHRESHGYRTPPGRRRTGGGPRRGRPRPPRPPRHPSNRGPTGDRRAGRHGSSSRLPCSVMDRCRSWRCICVLHLAVGCIQYTYSGGAPERVAVPATCDPVVSLPEHRRRVRRRR